MTTNRYPKSEKNPKRKFNFDTSNPKPFSILRKYGRNQVTGNLKRNGRERVLLRVKSKPHFLPSRMYFAWHTVYSVLQYMYMYTDWRTVFVSVLYVIHLQVLQIKYQHCKIVGRNTPFKKPFSLIHHTLAGTHVVQRNSANQNLFNQSD